MRLRRLADIPALPHGTEVVTKVDRVVGERRVPRGSVGRVARNDADSVDVTVVGFGTVRYARTELTARRIGQLQYAHRRADAWQQLRSCVVLDVTVGSRAWGLADEHSDEDRRGVYVLPLSWTQGLAEPPRDLVSADGSATYWEIGKAIRQALRADPNTLEMLFLPAAAASDPIGQWLLDERDAFVSTEIYGTFGRYALGQLRKLEQGLRLANHRALVLDWLRDEPTLGLDDVAARLALTLTGDDASHRAREYVKQLYRSLADQGVIAANEFTALVAFSRDHAHDFDLPRELRPKNAYNLLRLLHTAAHWLRAGTPAFEMHGSVRDRLLAIKRGIVPLADVLAEAEALAPALEAARDESVLPARPDLPRIDALLHRIGHEVARRCVQNAPGPLGQDAPPPPEVTWND